jgi:hypothetical protein
VTTAWTLDGTTTSFIASVGTEFCKTGSELVTIVFSAGVVLFASFSFSFDDSFEKKIGGTKPECVIRIVPAPLFEAESGVKINCRADDADVVPLKK